MSRFRRIAVVLIAYLCAVISVACAFLIFGYFLSDESGWDLNEWVFGIAFFGAATAIYSLPVALPVVLITETRKIGHWAVFAIAGLVLGVVLTIAFTEVPFRGVDPKLAFAMIALSVSGAVTYWLVAWKLPRRMRRALDSAG